MKQFLNFINGEYTASGKTFEKRTPIDNPGGGARGRQPEVDAAVLRPAPRWTDSGAQRRSSGSSCSTRWPRRSTAFDDFLAAEVADTGKPHAWPRMSTFRGGSQFQDLRRHHQERGHGVVRDGHAGGGGAQLHRPFAARRDRRWSARGTCRCC